MLLASLQQVANIAQLVGLSGLLLGVGAAWWQVHHTARAARSQFILAADAALAEHRALQNKLNRRGWDVEEQNGPPAKTPEARRKRNEEIRARNEVRRYIAVFERLGVGVLEGWITPELVDQLYSARLAKLLKKEGIRKLVERNPAAWYGFIYLWASLYKRHQALVAKDPRKKNELPKPPFDPPGRWRGRLDRVLRRRPLIAPIDEPEPEPDEN